MNSKLHAVCDGRGRPVAMLLLEGEMSDEALIADRGYDSDGYRGTLEEQGITPCFPPRRTRKVQHAYDRAPREFSVKPHREKLSFYYY